MTIKEPAHSGRLAWPQTAKRGMDEQDGSQAEARASRHPEADPVDESRCTVNCNEVRANRQTRERA